MPPIPPPSPTLDPLQRLRECAQALEAAMSVALATPEKKAVRKLRSLARRMEAQLLLLTQLRPQGSQNADPTATENQDDEGKELHHQIRRLGRAAGKVRDLDVLRGLLKDDLLLPREAADTLSDELAKRRVHQAAKLQHVVMDHLPRVVATLEQVVQAAGAAKGLPEPRVSSLPLIEHWRQSQEPQDARQDGVESNKHLHTLRKLAKTARYMIETLPSSPAAEKAMVRYQAQQDAGGRWHDWLELSATAKERFGHKHPLAIQAAEQTETARAAFLVTLAAQAGT